MRAWVQLWEEAGMVYHTLQRIRWYGAVRNCHEAFCGYRHVKRISISTDCVFATPWLTMVASLQRSCALASLGRATDILRPSFRCSFGDGTVQLVRWKC